jgi:hypothetical protein
VPTKNSAAMVQRAHEVAIDRRAVVIDLAAGVGGHREN